MFKPEHQTTNCLKNVLDNIPLGLRICRGLVRQRGSSLLVRPTTVCVCVWFLAGGGAQTTEMRVRAGGNVTLPCMGLTGISIRQVSELDWLCFGCLDRIVISVDESIETKLIEYRDGLSTVYHHHGRISLVQRTFALKYDPVQVQNSGRYLCEVNGHRSPRARIQLIVQGKEVCCSHTKVQTYKV